MSADRPIDDSASPRVRSRVSNGSSRLLFGDGRSAGARRYRDLCSAFSRDLGEPLTAEADQVVRTLAQVTVELEVLAAERAAGNTIDQLAFSRLIGLQRRLLRDLERLKTAAVKPAPNLADHLAANYARKPSEAA